jgi:hypothetical protein
MARWCHERGAAVARTHARRYCQLQHAPVLADDENPFFVALNARDSVSHPQHLP